MDDDTASLQVVGGILKDMPVKIHIARNGAEAVQRCSKTVFEVILLDIEMPVMDGYEACRIIQRKGLNLDTPVIFFTVHTDEQSILKAFELGAVDYVTKPFRHAELKARLNTQIHLRMAEREKIALRTEHLKRKLITASLHLHEKQELLNSVYDQLKELVKKNHIDLIDRIDRVLKRFGGNLTDKPDWEEFDQWFGEIHSRFYPRLLEQFPDLTQRELKVCAMIRLNFQSKDIAAIFYLKPSTIEIYRHRIRKKMSLPPGENLYKALCRF